MKTRNTLFVALLALAGLFTLSAFQTATPKFGVVDLGVIAEKSKLGAKKKVEFDTMKGKINELMNFIGTHKVVSAEECQKLRELWLTEKPTDDQKKQLDNMKTSVVQRKGEWDTLVRKVNPDAAEKDRLNTLAEMTNASREVLRQWNSEFGVLMQQLANSSEQEVVDKVREAVKKHAKAQGYTMVFETTVAVYGANDVTEDALKVMDQDNP
ncbi:hypothetical protein FCG40_09540 [Fimbriimonadia bacterium ATM]|nr:MAG: hypothetical protein EDM73_10700 [Armatimonadota bacterium]MBC6970811.1 hypothetical protein [Armatimonadota bacterium]MCE7899429.1 hypothetical protein [Armatimonadetes bacterium ATM1]MDL1929220.1 hypothetical protein [Fimbriimonadia bacterium ATM]RIJ94585.1 MAG: hypothetical protein DCC45_12285 [Armatimonadota bacterium]